MEAGNGVVKRYEFEDEFRANAQYVRGQSRRSAEQQVTDRAAHQADSARLGRLD